MTSPCSSVLLSKPHYPNRLNDPLFLRAPTTYHAANSTYPYSFSTVFLFHSVSMKPMIYAALLLLVPIASAMAPAAESPLTPIYPDSAPVCSPEELKKVVIPNTTIESVTVDERDGAVRVMAIVTHPPASDRVKVWIALPTKNWNEWMTSTSPTVFKEPLYGLLRVRTISTWSLPSPPSSFSGRF